MSPSYFHVIEPKGDPCANLYPLATICRTSPIWSVLILSDPASTENFPHAHCAPVFVESSTVWQRGACHPIDDLLVLAQVVPIDVDG